MVRTTKSEKPASTAAPENTVKPKKSSKKEAAAPAPVETPKAIEVEVPAEEAPESTVFNKLTEFNAKMTQLTNLFSSLKTDFKTLEKTERAQECRQEEWKEEKAHH